MKTMGYLLAVFLSATLRLSAQTPVFSQYYASALYLNPALAGLEKDTYLGLNYRSQWSNLNLPFTTFQFSFIQPITKPGTHKKHLGGVGLSFFNDTAGASREFVTQGVSLSGAYNFHLNRHGNNIIALAVQGGINQQKINYDALHWSSQYSTISGFDPSQPGETGITNYQLLQPMLNAGIMWYYTNKQRNLSYFSTSLYNGLSVSNLVRSNGYYVHSKDVPTLLYKLHGGITSTWSRNIEFSPNYLVELQDHNFQINLGTYIGYTVSNPKGPSRNSQTKILFGVWYRLQDAFIVSTGFSNPSMTLGFSYDSNIHAFSKSFGYGNAYELSMACKIVNKSGFRRFSSPLI